jgi:hypothetical protein
MTDCRPSPAGTVAPSSDVGSSGGGGRESNPPATRARRSLVSKTGVSRDDCPVWVLGAVVRPGHPRSSGDETGSLVHGTGVPISADARTRQLQYTDRPRSGEVSAGSARPCLTSAGQGPEPFAGDGDVEGGLVALAGTVAFNAGQLCELCVASPAYVTEPLPRRHPLQPSRWSPRIPG